MAKTTPRLHVASRLEAGQDVILEREQGHYLVNVLRMKSGDPVHVFNGEDGEFLSYLATVGKKQQAIRVERQISDVRPPPDIGFLFAPLKHARLDYMVQKATELGARFLQPVITARTMADRVNLDRMRANAVEAAEQCNGVYVPQVREPVQLLHLLRDWEKTRTLIFCDEKAAIANPVVALQDLAAPAAILVGPEGGFTDEERQALLATPKVRSISLGPRIMRADTAAVASLALVQAVLGDWS